MNFRKLLTEDRAVSPVIGVILMVAITVILAAVIGTFVLGLGDQVSESAPQAQFTFQNPSAGTVTITHDGGDAIVGDNIEFAGAAAGGTWTSNDSDINTGDEVTAGESISLTGLTADETLVAPESKSVQL